MRLKLHTQILLGLVLGVVAGLLIGPRIVAIRPIGDAFIRLITMIVVPLVFASILVGVASLGGKRVAVIPGTTTEKSLDEAMKRWSVNATVVPVKDHAAGVVALDSGTADAYASDRVILIGIGRTSKDPSKLSLVSDYFSYEPYGLMMRRGDPAFRLSVNRALAAMYRSREVVPIFEKWFGSMSTAGPLIGAMYVINGLPE